MDASDRAEQAPVKASLWVWLATACGLGRLPWAPGTWGSVAGLAVGWAAAGRLSSAALAAALLASFVACAWVSGRAEREMKRHDPLDVVLDEVWGMATILLVLPTAAATWPRLLLTFVLFRCFDTLKPPPLKLLARLPGGWGIMADDAGAAGYALAITWLVLRAGWL